MREDLEGATRKARRFLLVDPRRWLHVPRSVIRLAEDYEDGTVRLVLEGWWLEFQGIAGAVPVVRVPPAHELGGEQGNAGKGSRE